MFRLATMVAVVLATLPTGPASAIPAKEPADVQLQPAGNDRTNVVVLACLRDIRQGFERLKQKYPKNLGHLGPGVIDEKGFSLHFPVVKVPPPSPGKNAARKLAAVMIRRPPLPPQPAKQGLWVEFASPLPTIEGPNQRSWNRCWPFVNVGFRWWWMWPNGSFPHEQQMEFSTILEKALGPLADAENAALAADLAGRHEQPYVLRGTAGLELTAEFTNLKVNNVHVVELYAKNRTQKPIALGPGMDSIFRDGMLLGRAGMVSLRVRGDTRDVFVYLKPGQRRKVGQLSLGRLPAGRYRIRIARRHARRGWLDMRPTFHDGSPAYRNVEGAWTGTLVSNRLDIEIKPPATDKQEAAEVVSAKGETVEDRAGGPDTFPQ